MTEEISRRAPGFRPRVAVVLGSGLGEFGDDVRAVAKIPYSALPDFPQTHVTGHAGVLILGHVGRTAVAVLQGRAHYYERGRADEMRGAIAALAALGCETLLLTNAAGSLRLDMPPRSLMVVEDHINLTGINPLFGEVGNGRFMNMVDAYDPALRVGLKVAGETQGIMVHEGVYAWFSGPSFETPAEIRAARALGADAVGMSTVPEAILGRYAGLKIAALSVITNYGAGMTREALSHAHTLALAHEAAQDLRKILRSFLEAHG